VYSRRLRPISPEDSQKLALLQEVSLATERIRNGDLQNKIAYEYGGEETRRTAKCPHGTRRPGAAYALEIIRTVWAQ
jgi:hypothetical protein